MATGFASIESVTELIQAARDVRPLAYAPYSKFRVGAALRAEDGRIFLGVNVENSAYPVCQCAERSAIGNAITAGARRFSAIAVVTAFNAAGQPGTPCGSCRQALSEFGLDLSVYIAGPEGPFITLILADLLPRAFTSADLG